MSQQMGGDLSIRKSKHIRGGGWCDKHSLGSKTMMAYQPPELTRYSYSPRTQLTWQMAQVTVGRGLWNTYYTYEQLHQKVLPEGVWHSIQRVDSDWGAAGWGTPALYCSSWDEPPVLFYKPGNILICHKSITTPTPSTALVSLAIPVSQCTHCQLSLTAYYSNDTTHLWPWVQPPGLYHSRIPLSHWYYGAQFIAASPTVSPNLRGVATAKFLKDDSVPILCAFFTALVKGYPEGPKKTILKVVFMSYIINPF